MEFLEKMNSAIEYIEERLEADIDYAELASLVGCTEYHLSRIFPFITGQSLSLYIRRRRLSRAAEELHQSALSLIDIAVKYGYSSVDSFSRAFREIHGISPAQVHSSHRSLRQYPKLTFTVSIKGADPMNVRLVEKMQFWIVGIKKNVPIVFSGPNKDIDAMWRTVSMEMVQRWKLKSDIEPSGIVSASTSFSEDRMLGTGTLDHYIGVATSSPTDSEPAMLLVQAGTWAVFESVGNFPEKLQNTWGRIYSEWLPSASYQIRLGPEILWNEGPDTKKPDFRSEIWIPVESRN
jgi:AraC family transcriptional regulator